MKRINIKINQSKLDLIKETKEQRTERIKNNFTYTRVVPNKKKEYKRADFKKFDY